MKIKGVLVGLTVQFILIIVISLLANKFSGFTIISPISIFWVNRPTLSLTSVVLFVLSFVIACLSGKVVNQWLKETSPSNKKNMLIREIEMKWQEIYEPNKKKVFDEIISDIKNIKSTQNKKCKKLLNEIEIFLKDNLAGLTKEKLDGVKGELDTLYKQVGESKKSKENKLQKILDDLVQDPDRKEPK